VDKIPLEYICFLNSSGYSVSSQNYLQAFENTGKFDIRIQNFGTSISRPSISDDMYVHYIKMRKKEENEESIQIYHCIPKMQRKVRKLKKNIGFATFETYDPPQNWLSVLNKNDGVITPSKFNYDVFAHANIKKPLFYVPHCLDFNIYNKEVKPLKKFDKFTFGFMGTWKVRKGYKSVIETWITHFSDRNDIQLCIKTDDVGNATRYLDRMKKRYGNSKGFESIIFEPNVFDEKTLPSFIKSFDCIVLPTSGEGFGLCGLQGMALGVPVIVTNYSGCKDYANEETATLIEPDGFILKSDMDGIEQFRNKKWAFISVENIKNSMNYVLKNQEKVNRKKDAAYDYVKENFNYEKIGHLFIDALDTLYDF
jgi:glycosyltransferase involved in cell wall biosynthesis